MLRQAFGGGKAEKRAISFQQVWGSGGFFGQPTRAGVTINQDNSLRIATLYACVRLLSDTVSTLSADTYRRINGVRVPYRPKPEWVDSPDPDIAPTRDEFITQVMVSLLLDGNAFIHIVRDRSGEIVALTVLDPLRVDVTRDTNHKIIYVFKDSNVVLQREEVLHITEMRRPGAVRGISRINQLKESLGLTAALDDFAARFFGQGSTVAGVIEVPGQLQREQARDLVDAFEEGHRGLSQAHRPGVLFGGASFKKIGVDPNEAQMLESRRQQVEEIAKVFRVPLHMLSTAIPGAQSYASVEQNAIQFATYTIRPYVTKIENALTTLLPPGVFIKFNMDTILRGDISTRFTAYSVGTQAGFLSVNDIRRLEDLSPVDGGDQYRVPLANVSLPAAVLAENEAKVRMAQALIDVGFDPESTLQALDLPAIQHTGIPPVKLQPLTDLSPAVLENY